MATHGFYSPDDLVDLTEKKFDYIVREIRVETFKEVNQAAKRKRVDKLLTKFEKEWRKYSGIRKTNMLSTSDIFYYHRIERTCT